MLIRLCNCNFIPTEHMGIVLNDWNTLWQKLDSGSSNQFCLFLEHTVTLQWRSKEDFKLFDNFSIKRYVYISFPWIWATLTNRIWHKWLVCFRAEVLISWQFPIPVLWTICSWNPVTELWKFPSSLWRGPRGEEPIDRSRTPPSWQPAPTC